MRKLASIESCLVLQLYFISVGCFNGDRIAKKRNREMLIGSYILDVGRTNLGKYAKDSVMYKNCTITFFRDSTFRINMKVPFIYDSSGFWEAAGAGVESWNYLYFDNERIISTQFTEPWTKDSIFYLNSITPAKGGAFIQEIYFKKIINSYSVP